MAYPLGVRHGICVHSVALMYQSAQLFSLCLVAVLAEL